MKRLVTLILALALALLPASAVRASEAKGGQIYLYGEDHAVPRILDAELKQWKEYYGGGMRHLFIEVPSYTAEYLNLWMQSQDDTILEEIYADWMGTMSHDPDVKAFYQQIKAQCPETVFHGTDVGHQYDTIGARYLSYLKSNGQEDSTEYLDAERAATQGRRFYETNDDVYRENSMYKNFTLAFDLLGGESVMGIYGAAHTGLAALDYSGKVPCMANQLRERYGDAVHSVDLREIPIRMDVIAVGGKEYQAAYYGSQEMSVQFHDRYLRREFWRLENAYEDFKSCRKPGDMLPAHNYPIPIATGQVFVIDYTKPDQTVERMYYRSDGGTWQGELATEQFEP